MFVVGLPHSKEREYGERQDEQGLCACGANGLLRREMKYMKKPIREPLQKNQKVVNTIKKIGYGDKDCL